MSEQQNKRAEKHQDLIAITKAYDLVREMSARVDKLPRRRKFVLGDRILSNAYGVLDTLIEARYTRDKVGLLVVATVRSAHSIDPAMVRDLAEALSGQLNRHVQLEMVVMPVVTSEAE